MARLKCSPRRFAPDYPAGLCPLLAGYAYVYAVSLPFSVRQQAVAQIVHIYVPDVDATYGKALAAGAESLQEPAQKGDPDKRGGVEAGGIMWWIATQLEE
jgi:uncharacterized glyoxalase superfamily protein PhnB